jgi:hypothetical protein
LLVSHRENFIYTKTSKTAGTSVEVLFEPYCIPPEDEWKFSHGREERVSEAGIIGYRGPDAGNATWRNHMPAAEIRDRLGSSEWESYFKFCVVRNPFDKAVSLFYYGQGSGTLTQRLKDGTKSFLRTISRRFLKFEFERWLRNGGLHVDRDKYVLDGEICMDDFIFFERLEEDVQRICDRLGLRFDSDRLPYLKSGHRPDSYSTADHYTSRSKEIVANAFDMELKTFGYEFPNGDVSAAPTLRSWQ